MNPMSRWLLTAAVLLVTAPSAAIVPAHQSGAPFPPPPLVWEWVSDLAGDDISTHPDTYPGPIVTLERGKGIRFPLAAGRFIRLQSDHAVKASLAELEILQSADRGWFYPLALSRPNADGTAVSLVPLAGDRDILIRNQGERALTFAVASGHYQTTPEALEWHPIAIDTLPAVHLRQHPQARLQSYHRLPHTLPQSFEVEGPALYSLAFRQTRNTLSNTRRNRVSVRLNNQPAERHYLHFTSDTRHRYSDGQDRLLLSLEEQRYLWVPQGRHRVTLRSDSELWFRLLEARHGRSSSVSGDRRDWPQALAQLRDGLLLLQQQRQSAVQAVLDGHQGAAQLAAASFDTAGISRWQQGLEDNLFRRQYTQERSLWPAGGAPERQLLGLETELALTPRDDTRFLAADTGQAGAEPFFEVAEEPVDLAMPETQGPTELELTLSRPERATHLFVDYGTQQQVLRFQPDQALGRGDWRFTPQSQQVLHQPGRPDRALVNQIRLPLPEGVRSVRITAKTGSAWLRASLREARRARFTEQEFWDHLRELGPAAFERSWRQPADDDAATLLRQDSQFFRDWLHLRYRSFIDDLSPPLGQLAPEQALQRLDQLQRENVGHLAQNYAQGLYVYARDARVRRQAFDYLVQTLAHADSPYPLQTLLATAYVRHGDRSVLPQLADTLYRLGYDREALKIALVLRQSPASPEQAGAMTELALKAAIQARWPLTFSELSERLDDPQREAWRALYRSEANQAEPPQADEPAAGQPAALTRPQPSQATVTPSAWLTSFNASYAGLWRWQDWRAGFTGEVDRVQVYNPDLDRFYQRQRVRPDAPLTVTVTGPVQLEVKVAPLHRLRDQRLDDWLNIHHHGQRYQFPIINNGVFNRHAVIGAEEYPGSVETVRITLGPGRHQLALNTQQHPALVQLQLATPEWFSAPYWAAQHAPAQCHTPLPPAGPKQRALPEVIAPLAPAWARPLTAISVPCVDFAIEADGDTATVTDADIGFSPAPAPGDMAGPALEQPLHQPLEGSAAAVSAFLAQVLMTEEFASRPELIAQSNALGARYPGQPTIQRRLARINHSQFWVREELILESAGTQRFDASLWPPTSPFLRQRFDLLGQPPAPSEHLLSGLEPLTISVNNDSSRQYRLQLRLDKPGFQRVSPVAVDVRVDGHPQLSRRLSEHTPLQETQFTLPAGSSQLELQLADPTSRHWVYFRLWERRDSQGAWQPVNRPQTRSYYAVTPQQPLTLFLDRPAWLRLESYDGRSWRHRYHYQPAAGYLTLRAGDLDGPYVRIYSLRHQPDRLTAPAPHSTPRLAPAIATPQQRANASTPAAFVSDSLQGQTRDAGTQGAFIELVQRRNFDNPDDRESERYLELGWRYQQHPLFSRLFWQSDVLARHHSDSHRQVLASRQWLTWRPDRQHWRLGLYGDGYWQPSQDAASVSGRVQLAGYMPLGHHLTWDHELTAFGRWLSADRPSRDGAFDDDVFTNYKDQHRYGLAWQESLVYRPWRDSRWRWDAGVRTNEDLSPDRFSLAMGWDQFWRRDTRTFLGLEQRWLLADDHRRSADSQQLLSAGIDWRWWSPQGRRWEAGLGLGMDLDTSEPSVKLSLEMDLPGAKRFADYRSERYPFFDLQQIDAAHTVTNNELNYVE
ncbi:hypothetical protein [Marinobacter sp. SS21]|uniref:hypothetical protein n=1 Tax=Marinobacter sp. SS21 TaxID=2979460 RepID=UPI00232E2116|nr:hypothetical protein [Marinobacter sp. SS21]MDC0662935.1 hypothetical protein [Marinobacter sp. SS21]